VTDSATTASSASSRGTMAFDKSCPIATLGKSGGSRARHLR
jgi:hypothetical protein